MLYGGLAESAARAGFRTEMTSSINLATNIFKDNPLELCVYFSPFKNYSSFLGVARKPSLRGQFGV
jgi:hypothetical protein